MTMRGQGLVAYANCGIVKIKTDDGFTVIQLLCSHSPAIGDQITWNSNDEHGDEIFENVTRKTHFKVYVQSHGTLQGQ